MSIRTFTYSRWLGGERTIEATDVAFHPTHIAFYDSNGRLLLAERSEQVNELREVIDGEDPS